LDETENTQDGKTSGDEKGTSEKTHTDKEVAEIKRNAESDALANAGRATAAAEKATKIANDAITKLKKAEERAYETDRERYKDDVTQLTAIEARRREGTITAELDSTRQELSEERGKREAAEEKVNESTKERNAREIATRLNVEPNLLGELSRLTDGSVEAIEANMLPKLGEVKKPLQIDQGGGTGGASGRKPTLGELKASDPIETDKKVNSGEWTL